MTSQTEQTSSAAQMIADELEAICTETALEKFAADESGNEGLEQHEALVRTRLGGDFHASAWGSAMSILRERHGASRYEQAVRGIEIRRGNGVVLVDDGQDRWLCWADRFAEARQALESRAAIPGDEGGAEAYGELCCRVRGPILTRIGTARGTDEERAKLLAAAVGAELVDADEYE